MMKISGLPVLMLLFLAACSSAPSEGSMDQMSLDEARSAADEAKSKADELNAQMIFPDVYSSAGEEYQKGMDLGEKFDFENGVMSYNMAKANYMEAYKLAAKAKEEATVAIKTLNESIKETERAVEEVTSAGRTN